MPRPFLVISHAVVAAAESHVDPRILEDDRYLPAVRAILRERYEADADYSEEAQVMVKQYALEIGMQEEVRRTESSATQEVKRRTDWGSLDESRSRRPPRTRLHCPYDTSPDMSSE